MATARDESAYGTGGKFKKRPFRRSTQTTPYDRPPTAMRNPTNININNNTGWFSKLVDPAQRLIISGVHRLFASVFRKRLPPPPPPPPEPGANNEEINMDKEQSSTDHAVIQGAIGSLDDLNTSSGRTGLIELEQILKQKTFSRSEIDRLTALLKSRTAEMPVGDEQKSPEIIPSKPVVLHNRKVGPLDTPFRDNSTAHQLILSPDVLDEAIASPVELAKAYMGSMPSKVSPSILGVGGQALREESTVLSNQPLPSASPVLSLVPRSSGNLGIIENGFVTPRFRGRSAIYSMARAPHSRVHSTTAFKGAGITVDSVAGPSSSPQSTWEKNRPTSSKQGSLKRRSSVMDIDIGAVGPIRRIRQKPNLLYSKSLSRTASGIPLSLQGSSAADTVLDPSSSLQKSILPSEPINTKLLTENGDQSVSIATSTPIPSKSSETASKILQQLDKLVSSKEKSPTKMSPSMLHGPALKSLDNVDSPIFIENVLDNNRSNGSVDTPLPDVKDSSFPNSRKVQGNGLTRILSPKLISTNVVDATGAIKNNVPSTKTSSALENSVSHPYLQKKHAFRMSAHEDYLELDDNDYSNGPPSMALADGRNTHAALVDQTSTVAAIAAEKSPACSNIMENNDGAMITGKCPVFASLSVPTPSITAQPAEKKALLALTSNKPANESNGSPIFGIGEKFASPKESNVVSPSFSSVSTNVDKVPQFISTLSSPVFSEPLTFKFGSPLNSKSESSTSLASDAVGATDSVTKVPESDKADNKVLFKTSETSLPSAASTSSSTAHRFSFGAPSNCSTVNNGSLASCPSSTSSSTPPLFSNTGFNQNSTVSFATTNGNATSITASSATTPAAAPIFKFGLTPVPSTSISPSLDASGVELTEAKKNETINGNPSAFSGTGSNTSIATSFATTGIGSSIFGGTSSTATTSSGSGTFAGTSLQITSTSNSSFGGTFSSITSSGSSICGYSNGASTTLSMHTQFGSTASATSFGLAANPTSSSSSIFGSSSSTATSFGSVPLFGSSSAASSEANSISSSSGATTNVFGSSWQNSKTSLFGSTFNSTSPSTGFLFGASASSVTSTSSSNSVFGSSTNASSSSMFPFTSAATHTSSQPAFGDTGVFAFGSAPSNNNDQMNTEDSMAEDTVPTTTPVVPAFGQQPTISPPSSFVFGSTTLSGANPFQFGSQQNLSTPQNPSPFQASGSLDFNAGGSFSLGTGGGDKSQRRMIKVRKPRKK